MVKRAGKRKGRRTRKPGAADPPLKKKAKRAGAYGSVQNEDGLPQSVDPEGDDHLKRYDSERLEIRSVARGWVMMDASEGGSDKVRQAMLAKMAQICTKSPDERSAIAAFRAFSQAEQRQQALQIAAMRATQLPAQVSVNVGSQGAMRQPDVPPMYEVLQDLLSQQEVQEVVSGGHLRDERQEAGEDRD